MLDKAILTAIVFMLLGTTAAYSQTTSLRRCGYVDGIYTCATTTESTNSTSTTTCRSAGGVTACASETEEKETTPAAPRVEYIDVNPADEARKARVRTETKYRDPVSVDLCQPPLRMTDRDGCQPRR